MAQNLSAIQACQVQKCEVYSMGKMKNIVYTSLTISIEGFKHSLCTATHFQLDTSNFFIISFCHSLTTTWWSFSVCDHVPHSALQFWVSHLLMKWKDKPAYETVLILFAEWSLIWSAIFTSSPFPIWLRKTCEMTFQTDKKPSDTYIPRIYGRKPHWHTGWLVGWTEATRLISWVLFTLFSLCSSSKWAKVSFREFAGPVKFMLELAFPRKLTLKRNASKCVDPQRWLRSLCLN